MTSQVTRLVDSYDLVIFDLDGVVYLGHEPIGGAVEAINELERLGPPVAYATNNASRRAAEVANLLVSLGIAAQPSEVVTSAQASARLLADRLPAGSKVLIVGGSALHAEIHDVGLEPVTDADARPSAVVQGYAPDVGWSQLAEACVAIRNGAVWVVTNGDTTLPSPRGPLPGNGSLVAAVRTALERGPDVVVGKPAPKLFQVASQRTGASKPLVVGDRLDTDIEGAVRAGMDSLLVMTGVTEADDLLAAPEGRRPTFIAADLWALGDGSAAAAVPRLDRDAPESACGGWRARRADTGLELDGDGAPMHALAALAALAWINGEELAPVTAAGGAAARVLKKLGLGG